MSEIGTFASDVYEVQARISSLLFQLFDGAFLSNTKKLIYPIGSAGDINRIVNQTTQLYSEFKNQTMEVEHSNSDLTVMCDMYHGTCECVHKLIKYLESELKADLVDAFVHGSLATDEELNYSDFDALLIFKDSIFLDKKRLASVVRRVLRARKILFDYDPLQHHGFFVLTESDLKLYPESVFPLVLFDFAKSLLYERRQLHVTRTDHANRIKNPIYAILRSIERRLQPGNRPHRLYELKILLSHVMLLPCLILQVEGCPVFKRESFERIKERFAPNEWKSIVIASEVRAIWPDLRRKLFSQVIRMLGNSFHGTIFQKKVGYGIPGTIAQKLELSRFYEHTERLVKAVNEMVSLDRACVTEN